VEIELDLAATLPPIRGDKLHLQQVLLNLVINGMDAMSDMPEPMRRINLSSGMNGDGMVSVSVRDRGPGIPPERLPRLFDSFFTTKRTGVGLGLSIARSIIEAHRGRIWAENDSNGGAVFHIALRAETT
jgi:two-component system sensor kinase FixL